MISSQPRYDHFDTSPYLIVFEFCTAFARPMGKCIHPKFKKNEAFARYCEKTRAFSGCGVIGSATFRVSPVMSCCGARNFLLAIRFAKFRPLPLLFAPFIRHRHANPKTHFVRFEDPCAAVANVPTSIRLRTPMCSIPHRPLKCKGMAQHSPKKRGGIIPPRQDLLSAPAIPS